MPSITDRARRFARTYEVPIPAEYADLERAAKAFGVPVFVEPGFHAAGAYINGPHPFIVVAERSKRILAHELGHAVLETRHHSVFTYEGKNSEQAVEHFAALLVSPNSVLAE